MKGSKYIVLIALSLLLLSGCSSGDKISKAEINQLNSKLESMDKQMTSLQEDMDILLKAYENSISVAASGKVSSDGSKTSKPQTPETYKEVKLPSDFNHYHKQALDLLSDVRVNTDLSLTKYKAYTNQTDELDDLMECYEKELVHQWNNKQIEKEAYLKKYKELKNIEKLLDEIEDEIETRFKIDD